MDYDMLLSFVHHRKQASMILCSVMKVCGILLLFIALYYFRSSVFFKMEILSLGVRTNLS